MLYTSPYWSNPLFLIFIFYIRALWRSGLSTRVPECQKLKMVGCTSMALNPSHSDCVVSGLTTEADRQRLEAIIRRGKCTDLCSEDHPALAELVERADDELFDKVLINSGHVLYSILPSETVSTYAFRRRRHNRELTSKTTHLEQCSFIVRMLYKDMY